MSTPSNFLLWEKTLNCLSVVITVLSCLFSLQQQISWMSCAVDLPGLGDEELHVKFCLAKLTIPQQATLLARKKQS